MPNKKKQIKLKLKVKQLFFFLKINPQKLHSLSLPIHICLDPRPPSPTANLHQGPPRSLLRYFLCFRVLLCDFWVLILWASIFIV